MHRYAEPEFAKPTYDRYFALVLLTTVLFVSASLLLYLKGDQFYGFSSEIKDSSAPQKVSQLKTKSTAE